MIDHQRSQIVIECDECAAVEESERGENFKAFWSRVSEDGWKSRSIGGVWIHACPKCELSK